MSAEPSGKVLQEELEQIDARRKSMEQGGSPGEAAGADVKQSLVGLAFSGGGIRSATFNLGVLQGLARLGLLRVVDFLSTVSGGGYIGSWFCAWVKREPGGLRAVERQLAVNADAPPAADATPGATAGVWSEPEPIKHLRRYSNYLAPRQGFLTADTWVLFATYLRNFMLCQTVILPTVVAVMVLSRLAMWFYHPYWDYGSPPAILTLSTGVAVLVVWFLAFLILFRAAARVRAQGQPALCPQCQNPQLPGERKVSAFGAQGQVVCLFLLTACLLCWFVSYPLMFSDLTDEFHEGWRLLAFALAGFVVVLLAFVCAALPWWLRHPAGLPRSIGQMLLVSLAGLIAGVILYFTFRLLHDFFKWDGLIARDYLRVRAAARVTTFGPPLILCAFVLGIFLAMGILNRKLREELGEWWSSLCAKLLITALVWLSVNFIGLYGTVIVLWATPWVRAAIVSGWALTVVGGVIAGRGAGTGPRPGRSGVQDLIATLAPHVFLVGILVGVSLLLHVALDNPPRWELADDAVWFRHIEPEHPPRKVTETTTRPVEEKPTVSSTRDDVVSREERIDEGEIVMQMYWVGMLNTNPQKIPTEDYHISSGDMRRLKEDGVPEDVLKTIRDMAIPHDLFRVELEPAQATADEKAAWETKKPFMHMSRSRFLEELDARLPPSTTYNHRVMIVRYAKNTDSFDFGRWEVFWKLLITLGVCVGLACLAAWMVDVNLFSLHGVYRNRLVRAYLGASRRSERRPDEVTELDPDDDVPLAELRHKGDVKKYTGPYPLINTAMNLVRGDRMDWQERKAEAFLLAPLYCGSEGTGYRPTKDGYGGNVTLGTAVTISGAAASPNMGYHSSPSVTALLTIFNARLGAWIGNPASPTRWQRSTPRVGFLHLFRELFGLTRAEGGYVYLSDGGHFENLGVYELVRRRCQYIIVSDAGADAKHEFFDLGALVRKVRVDFGIRIDITLDEVGLKTPRRSRWHCAIGRIRYDDVDPSAVPGILVYIKPSLTGDEPADVLHYAEAHTDFPHESTADQFFNESQFESYRALGRHVAEAVFTLPVDDVREAESDRPDPTPEQRGERHRWRCRELFSAATRRWFALPPEYEGVFIHSTDGYVAMQQELQEDPLLWKLAADIYPELYGPEDKAKLLEKEIQDGKGAARRRAEAHFVPRMLQVIENAWLSLNLEVHYAHPLNRGWLGVFHRWTNAPTVRKLWPMLRSELSRGFVDFCEKQMRMGRTEGKAVERTREAGLPEILEREFRLQWPGQAGLEERWTDAARAWLIEPGRDDDAFADPRPDEDRTCGIIIVGPAQADPKYPSSEPVYDLFVWVRGAYRNSGLGRSALAKVLEELARALPRPCRLRVRLPVAGMSGPGGKLQRAMWLTFFHHFSFRRCQPVSESPAGADIQEDEDLEVVLDRIFPAARADAG